MIGSFCCHRLMALSCHQGHSPGNPKIAQPAKWHWRHTAVMPMISDFVSARSSVRVLENDLIRAHFVKSPNPWQNVEYCGP